MDTPHACTPFWRSLRTRGDAIALVDSDANEVWTYERLHENVQAASRRLAIGRRSLVLLFPMNDTQALVWYLAALVAGHAVLLSPLGIAHPGGLSLIERFRPELVIWRGGPEVTGEYHVDLRRSSDDAEPHEKLALVLPTSASTGSAKAARLSYTSLAVGASQVAHVLKVSAQDRVLASLPFSYVYGLSVVNSTLHAGASLAFVRGTAADREYWRKVAASGSTTIATVSQTLDYMRHLKIGAERLPQLRKLTHSGDALDPGLCAWTYEQFGRRGVDMYLMYGQTEAGGRISVLDPGELPQRSRSVGRAMSLGKIETDARGEIIYRGPGVMLGYASGREDLALGDLLGGVLRTGDIGHLDEAGFLYLTGRLSRFCKLFGRRISLDDIESFVRVGQAAAVVEKNGSLIILLEGGRPEPAVSALGLARHFQLPPHVFRIETVPALPRTRHGKIDYRTLLALA